MRTYKERPKYRKQIEQLLLKSNNSAATTLKALSEDIEYSAGLRHQAQKMWQENRRKIPMVKGFIVPPRLRTDNQVILFWCPFCKTNHIHGWPKESDKKEHRGAHCFVQDSPFKKTGYFIKPYTKREVQRMAKGLLV